MKRFVSTLDTTFIGSVLESVSTDMDLTLTLHSFGLASSGK